MDLVMDLINLIVRNSIAPATVVFIVIVAWTYLPSRKAKVESYGRIPFDDDYREDAHDAH